MPGDSFSNLIIRFVCGFLFVVVCAWLLFRTDHETMRLFNLKKLYGLTKDNDETELKKTNQWFVIGYSFFLIIAMAATLFMGFQIWTRL